MDVGLAVVEDEKGEVAELELPDVLDELLPEVPPDPVVDTLPRGFNLVPAGGHLLYWPPTQFTGFWSPYSPTSPLSKRK